MTTKIAQEKGNLVWVKRSLLSLSQQQESPTKRNRRSFGRSKSFDDKRDSNSVSAEATAYRRHRHHARSRSGDGDPNTPTATAAPTEATTEKGGGSSEPTDSNNTSTSTSIDLPSSASAMASSLTSVVWQSTPYEWLQGHLVTSAETNNEEHGDTSADLHIRILPDSNDNSNSNDNQNGSTSITLQVPSSKLHSDVLFANTGNCTPDDLTQLEHFHEPAIVACLEARFRQQAVYTRTGPVLIAVNPFAHWPHLYADEIMQQYWNKAEDAVVSKIDSPQKQPSPSTTPAEHLPPHAYAIADDSFRSMMRAIQMQMTDRNDKKKKRLLDQSILVSGESGAGKTVTTKYIMKYLAALSQRAARAAVRGSTQRAYQQVPTYHTTAAAAADAEEKQKQQSPTLSNSKNATSASIESQVLQSNPILESFGNARTVRNDNSSRFGKFMEMQFSTTGRLMGTVIKTYLLEKVRVIQQSPGERNYHVFYQLLASASTSSNVVDLQKLGLVQQTGYVMEPADFTLLGRSGTFTRRDGVSDAKTFQELTEAMSMMSFTEQDRFHIFATTAAILHASNLTFVAQDESCRLDQNNLHLKVVCDLLGVSFEALNHALCFRRIKAAGSDIQSPVNKVKAQKGLDAMLKATYGAIFSFLVQRVNASIAASNEPTAVIGVLDIFGFESFAVNSFEQLCINYCNEVLQQQFNTFMLKNEQDEYASEGIDWEFIKFPENQDVLDLSNLIMSILDDMCRAPGATDKSFALEVVKRCETLSRFEACYKKSSPFFSIQHYAGTVEYSTDWFVEKNRDDLPRETSMLLMGSTNPFVHWLAEIIAGEHNNGADVAPSSNGNIIAKTSSRPTVGGQFRQQVKELRAKIDSTRPHYVRCIKPNALLAPGRFDCEMVVNQLRCGGVLQAVSVTRDGFTLHYTHAEFLSRYKGLLRDSNDFSVSLSPTPSSARKEACTLVDGLLNKMESMMVPEGDSKLAAENSDHGKDALIQFGKSKVLLKHHAFEFLEVLLGAMQNEYATRLNAMFRRHLCRVAFLSVRACFLRELRQQGQTFDEWFKENREIYYQPRSKKSAHGAATVHIPNIVSKRMEMFKKASSASFQKSGSSVEKATIDLANPAWLLLDGLWARNPNYQSEETS